MTIVEEIDKKSGRPHRSKNITDALKYLFKLDKTPQNISEAVKGYSGGSGPAPTRPTDRMTLKASGLSYYEFSDDGLGVKRYGNDRLIDSNNSVVDTWTELAELCISNSELKIDLYSQDGLYFEKQYFSFVHNSRETDPLYTFIWNNNRGGDNLQLIYHISTGRLETYYESLD